MILILLDFLSLVQAAGDVPIDSPQGNAGLFLESDEVRRNFHGKAPPHQKSGGAELPLRSQHVRAEISARVNGSAHSFIVSQIQMHDYPRFRTLDG